MRDWIHDYLTRQMFASQRQVSVLKSTTEIDPKRIMEDLRREDPQGAMLLGEYVVVDDPRNDPPPHTNGNGS